jgi:hypothetical protein
MGSALGATAVLTQGASVQVVEQVERAYLPVVGTYPNRGVWYMRVSPESSPPSHHTEVTDIPSDEATMKAAEGDGAIMPTHFLNGVDALFEEDSPVNTVSSQAFDEGEPRVLALDEVWGRAYVGLSGGGLAVFNLDELEVENYVPLGNDLVGLTPGPRAGTAYGVLTSNEVVLIDVVGRGVIARASDLGRPRGLVFDPGTGSLLVADADEGVIVRYRGDLSERLATRSLSDLPDQIALDSAGRRLYVMLPGARRVLALDADTLRPVAEAKLVGGPLIEMAFDAARRRLYVLSALSPRYRGIAVLKADGLSSLALVAGSPGTPLKRATALAVSSEGYLLAAEGARLYQISPEDFEVKSETRLENPVTRGGLVADVVVGQALWVGPTDIFIKGVTP